jgi:hypothetical protein
MLRLPYEGLLYRSRKELPRTGHGAAAVSAHTRPATASTGLYLLIFGVVLLKRQVKKQTPAARTMAIVSSAPVVHARGTK